MSTRSTSAPSCAPFTRAARSPPGSPPRATASMASPSITNTSTWPETAIAAAADRTNHCLSGRPSRGPYYPARSAAPGRSDFPAGITTARSEKFKDLFYAERAGVLCRARASGGLSKALALNAPQVAVVRLAQPALGDPGILERLPEGRVVEVAGVRRQPPAELGGVPDVPVAGHHQAHTGHRRQCRQPGAVVAERILRRRVQQRYLHVGAHVAGHKDADLR